MAHKKVRVAIIGVGNCASSLVQGVQFYQDTADDALVPGLMHTRLGGYHIRDIEFTLGIDVNVTKVGKTYPKPSLLSRTTRTSLQMCRTLTFRLYAA